MNFHTDEWIMNEVHNHYEEAKKDFSTEQIVGIFYQGSGNYGLDTENSDVDTKLIVLPSFREIAFNCKPVSTTHIRENDEHIDYKDLRLYFQTFRKQNLNFLEILFTKYYILNPNYSIWYKLVEKREEIARYNPYLAIKSMKGIAMEKYHAMEHRYPSKIDIINKYGYDPKQLHHLLRVYEYISRYISGEKYEDCLRPRDPEYLVAVKNGKYNLAEARELADLTINLVTKCADEFTNSTENLFNEEVDMLLDEVQYEIMETAVRRELL